MLNHSLSRRALLKAGAAFVGTTTLSGVKAQPSAARPATQASASAYTRLFPGLPGAQFDSADLKRLALGDGAELTGMSAEPETLKQTDGQPKRDAQGHLLITATPEDELDDEENFGMPAGYSYLGQFIDHDLTLNPVEHFGPLSTGMPTENLRSASFDLDCVYGRGPVDQPYLYQDDGLRLLVGRSLNRAGVACNAHDHPRLRGRAILGDKRNDENVLVSQMHGVFVAFHNKVAADHPRASFAELRQIVTLHYQWMILTDFLPRLLGVGVMAGLLPGFGDGGKVNRSEPRLTVAKNLPKGQIPLEFVDAAYRFGHSLIRPVYRLNAEMRGTEQELALNPALSGRRQIFAASYYAGLNGFREFPAEWAIDWRLYFEIDRKLDYRTAADGPKRVQASYKIDTALTNPLAFLPEFSAPGDSGAMLRDPNGQPVERAGQIANLAYRNLRRGVQDQLPSGQAVARAMGLTPLDTKDLKVGKANLEGLKDNRSIAEYGASFNDAAPLWFYVLAEAQHAWTQKVVQIPTLSVQARNAVPTYLGPVGGQLVGQSFIAMLRNDPRSILHADSQWRPKYLRQGRFDMPALVVAAGLV
jgi:hypothetical protein